MGVKSCLIELMVGAYVHVEEITKKKILI